MNILIVANHFAVCSARYAADAFTRLGHNVKHVGRPTGREIWGIQVPQEYEWEPDFDHVDSEYWWETSDGKAAGFAPDLVLAMDSDPALLDAIGGISDWCAPLAVYGVDNHVRDYRRPYFDHYFLAHKSVSVMPWDWETETVNHDITFGDYEDMTWLPCAYDPVAFPPSPIPFAEREYDVCMIGVMYPKRWELVTAMRAAGLKVLAGTGLVYDQYRDIHHNSRIALVSSFNGDLPIRLFEGAGMGCAVLADAIADLSLLGDGSPINVYTSVDEAVRMAKDILRHPRAHLTPKITATWATAHTWDVRAETIISWYNERK